MLQIYEILTTKPRKYIFNYLLILLLIDKISLSAPFISKNVLLTVSLLVLVKD